MFDPTKTHPGDPIDPQVFHSVHQVQEKFIQKTKNYSSSSSGSPL